MIKWRDSEFNRYLLNPNQSWLVGIVKKECQKQWILTLNQITIPDQEECIASSWGGCNYCPMPMFEIRDLTELDLEKPWGPGSICMHDIAPSYYISNT